MLLCAGRSAVGSSGRCGARQGVAGCGEAAGQLPQRLAEVQAQQLAVLRAQQHTRMRAWRCDAAGVRAMKVMRNRDRLAPSTSQPGQSH